MITRIVRMEFRPEAVAEFRQIFADSSPHIRTFAGCLGLQLHQDADLPHVLYTHSLWESPEHLEAYRQSELFARTWAATKVLFAGKPLAYSLNKLVEVGVVL